MGIGFHLQEILGKLEIEKGIYYPHNYLFESLAIGGILMTLPLFYCMFFPMIGFYKNLKIDPNVLPSGLMATQAFFIQCIMDTSVIFRFSGWLWE